MSTGLYFAGGSAHPGPGMPMALMSGWIAADALDQDAGTQSTSAIGFSRGRATVIAKAQRETGIGRRIAAALRSTVPPLSLVCPSVLREALACDSVGPLGTATGAHGSGRHRGHSSVVVGSAS